MLFVNTEQYAEENHFSTIIFIFIVLADNYYKIVTIIISIGISHLLCTKQYYNLLLPVRFIYRPNHKQFYCLWSHFVRGGIGYQ